MPVVPWEPAILHFDLPTSGRAARALYYFQRLGYPGAPAVATVSSDVATHFREHSFRRQRLYFLPNPVDGNELRGLAAHPHVERGTFRFCSLGRLAAPKGLDILLRAFAIANAQLPTPWELLILGDGNLRSELRALAESLEIADQVRFCGFVKNPYPVVASADVFVHSARWEAFGVAILEAAALSLPIIATDCPGGPREILADGAGMLVPPEDPAAFAQALIEVSESEELRRRLCRNARSRADVYAPIHIARRVLELIQLIEGVKEG